MPPENLPPATSVAPRSSALLWVALGVGALALAAMAAQSLNTPAPATPAAAKPKPAQLETATLGAGCFWCIEAVLERVPGVYAVESGYMGGEVKNPTYEQVCTGETGHAEVVCVQYDPTVIPYDKLLEWFFKLHDPTTLNRQGADVGTQYRSAIFFHNDAQKAAAAKALAAAQKNWPAPIVTEITAATEFYPAEEYHQDYFRLNPSAGYCRYVIAPKLEKLKPGEATPADKK